MRSLSTVRSSVYFAIAMTIASQSVEAQDRSQGRSMVISRNGVVAAESPLAAQAGVRILERGGNAVDAAIATNAMMGGVDGWQKLADKFGRKKLAEDLAAAIRMAQDGFPVPEWTAAYWAGEVDYLRTDETAAKTYLPGDRAPKMGEVFRNPELAWSLEQIAQHGREAFYKGEIAAKILESMKRHNGPMVAQDLVEYSSEFVEPISTTYRDWTVYELPPNVQGIAALEMLNIMETFPMGQKDWGFGSTKALHAMIEAKKLAYADLAKYIGDPRNQKLPVAMMLSKEWAAQRTKLIDPDRANCERAAGEMPPGSDTTYLSVVDREGNMVSLIQSNYAGFGSGVV